MTIDQIVANLELLKDSVNDAGKNTLNQILAEIRERLVDADVPVSTQTKIKTKKETQMKPTINSSLTANGNANQGFSYQIRASENPTSYRASGLPSNLSLNTTSGVISGTTSVSGHFSVSLWASNANGESDGSTLVITVV